MICHRVNNMKTTISGQGRSKVKECRILMLLFGATHLVVGWHPWHASSALPRGTLKPHFRSSHQHALSALIPVRPVSNHFNIHLAHNLVPSSLWVLEISKGICSFWVSFPCCIRMWFSTVVSWMLYMYFSWTQFQNRSVFLVHGWIFWSYFLWKQTGGMSVSLLPVPPASSIHSCSVGTHSPCIVFVFSPDHPVTLISPLHLSFQLRLEFISAQLLYFCASYSLSLGCGPGSYPHTAGIISLFFYIDFI